MILILSKLSKRFLYNEIDFKASIIGIKGGRGLGKTTSVSLKSDN